MNKNENTAQRRPVKVNIKMLCNASVVLLLIWKGAVTQAQVSGGPISGGGYFYPGRGWSPRLLQPPQNGDNNQSRESAQHEQLQDTAVQEQQRKREERERAQQEAAAVAAARANFIAKRNEAAAQLKGVALGHFDLKGFGSCAVSSFELKGLSEDSTFKLTFGDSMTVDGRRVPSGLPKFVENSIPNTPAGARVRKGFEGIVNHDWKVALAWFQDASNEEPNNYEWKRLVDLASYTLTHQTPSTGSDKIETRLTAGQNTGETSPIVKGTAEGDELSRWVHLQLLESLGLKQTSKN